MTDAEFRAFVDQARAELARLDALVWSAMTPAERAAFDDHRRACIDLRDSMADEALQAELEATEHAGRDLAPDEVAKIRKRQ